MANTAGTTDLIEAFTGGNALENAAYAKEAGRVLAAQNAQAMLDKRVVEATMANRKNESQESFPNILASAITNMPEGQTTFGKNQMAALIPTLLSSGYGSASDFDTMMKSLARISMEGAAGDAGLNPMNVASQVFNMDTVPAVEKIGDLMVRNNLTDTPEVDQVMTAFNSAAGAAADKSGSMGVYEQRIQNAMKEFNLTRAQAVAFVDKYVSQDINEYTGNVVRQNILPQGSVDIPGYNSAATEVPIQGGTSAVPPPLPGSGQSLWDVAGSATGIGSSFSDLIGRAVSLLGADPNMESTAAIQTMNTSVQDMVRALSINPRFPVAEQERIIREINISPGWFTSEQTLKARMTSLRGSLELRAKQAQRDADDPSLTQDIRKAQGDNAAMIRNFLPKLSPSVDANPELVSQVTAELKALPGWGGLSAADQQELIQRALRDRGGQ